MKYTKRLIENPLKDIPGEPNFICVIEKDGIMIMKVQVFEPTKSFDLKESTVNSQLTDDQIDSLLEGLCYNLNHKNDAPKITRTEITF